MAMASKSSGNNTGDCVGDLNGKSQRKVGLLYDETMCKHDTPGGEDHPECPDRIRVIWETLQLAGVSQRCVVLGGSKVQDKHLQLVHSQDHVNLVKKLSTKQRDYRRNRIASKLDSIYLNGGSSEAAYLAAGSVVEVAEKVAEGELDCGFAIVRPPGHHAEPDEAMGFCLFNNVAVAASYLLNERPDLGIKKILIVDWDVHHGNGTQKMFWKDSRVLLFSVHRHEHGNFYPGGDDGYYDMVGEGPGEGFNINVPWEQGGCGDADYFAAWDHILLPVAKEFKPDIVLLSAGFDAAINDPLGGCLVTPYGYSVMLMKLMVFAQGKIVMALEGGYNLDSIAKSSLACVQVLLELKPIQGSCEAYPLESTRRVIQAVRKRLRTYWPSLADELSPELIDKKTPTPIIIPSSTEDYAHGIMDQMSKFNVENRETKSSRAELLRDKTLLKKAKSRLESLEAEHAQTRARHESLEVEEAQTRARLEYLKAEEAQIRARLKSLEAVEAQTRARHESLEDEEAHIQARLKSLEALEVQTRARHESLEAEEAQNRARNEYLKAEEAQTRARHESLEAKEVQTRARLDYLEDEEAQIQARLKSLEAVEAQTRARHESLEDQGLELLDLRKRLKEAHLSLENEREKVQVAVARAVDAEEELKSSMAFHKKTHSQLERLESLDAERVQTRGTLMMMVEVQGKHDFVSVLASRGVSVPTDIVDTLTADLAKWQAKAQASNMEGSRSMPIDVDD